jgi:protein-tyrosine phosphatase
VFLIQSNLPGALPAEDQRHLLNFRSLAGTPAADGRTLKAGRLFRGGHVAVLPEALAEALRMAGVTSLCDLRSAEEQAREPSALVAAGFAPAMPPPAGDPTLALRVVGDPSAEPADVRAAMLSTYAAMPERFAPALGRVLQAAIDAPGGLLVQCAIGKDRTGVAIALLLAALGVQRARILADYTASNGARDAIYAALAARNAGRTPPPAAMLAPLLAADPAYLAAFWDRLDTDWGGEAGYLITALDISADAIGALRARWLV